MRAPELSIVVPLDNEELVIEEMHRRLAAVLTGAALDYEIVLVDDGSQDNTAELAQKICSQDKRVKFIRFSRNFGHQIAITAGMDRSSGKAVIVIDDCNYRHVRQANRDFLIAHPEYYTYLAFGSSVKSANRPALNL